MITEGTVNNKYVIMNPELCELNNIFINKVINYDKRFEFCEILCKWKIMFTNDISIDVKFKVTFRISVLCNILEIVFF